MAYEGLAARRGAVVVMSLETGEVLAMVSSPAYDPNVFADSQLKFQASGLFNDSQAPFKSCH